MNLEAIEKIANAVLYEGYLLYPYRASSVKNRQRFNFGVLYPPAYETGSIQTECLVRGDPEPEIEVKVRFLQVGAAYETYERERTSSGPFSFADPELVEGEIETSLQAVADGLYRMRVRIQNLSNSDSGTDRESALRRSMISVHTILTVRGGEFVSLLDPPEEFREAAGRCRNIGVWPVLVGSEGERDAMLSSPIILYDYPQIAPESPGDLFDGTEIDEILTLRIMTLTDEEKDEVRNGGDRGRRILERTENMPAEQFLKLHGALRGLRSGGGG